MFLPSNITLQLGDNGDFVAELQRRLVGVKSLSEDAVTGSYDGRTVNGVISFQMRSGIRADGVAGPETLRRLNAVMAGGSWTEEGSTGSSSAEEEAARAAANVTNSYRMMDDQAMSPQGMPMDIHGNGAGAAALGAAAVLPAAAIAMSESQNLQQQLMKESQQFQQQQGQSYDQVAQTLQQQQMMQRQMLMQQQMQQQQAMMAQQQMPPQMDPNLAPQAQQQPGGFGAKPPAGQLPPQQSQQSQPLQQPQGGLPQAESAPEQKQGILGKAMAKMDALVQKLASYFEAKLPPDVLSEVKHLGAVMAASGVKENRLPEAPDQVRVQATPARAPEPMQTPQRN
jgi:murein L,D-transpeptidase YcbB/YkuD